MTEKVILGNCTLYHGDCLDVLSLCMADNSVDAIVCDPPYGLGFMGKHWDHGVPSAEVWAECLRVLKPGGHLLAFAGTRTQHRMAVNIEDAGFEIRDMIAWVYGSGFPKSLDVSKAIDKAAGAERTEGGRNWSGGARSGGISHGGEQSGTEGRMIYDTPASDAARQWSGYGTALKPALEPITVARKPLIGTVAENVLTFGTGAINVDGCRVPGEPTHGSDKASRANGTMGEFKDAPSRGVPNKVYGTGRWPANLIHDGSEEVVTLFPDTGKSTGGQASTAKGFGEFGGGSRIIERRDPGYGDTGSAARFFCAKANKRDRGDGNNHPTVKPTDLMRYLCRLVTPPGGLILDPFAGSGSTGKAAVLEGFRFIGIEREAEYVEIARARIEQAYAQPRLFDDDKQQSPQEQVSLLDGIKS